MADKFKVGERVICVAPHPEGLRGYWGRRGVVQTQRQWWTLTFDSRKLFFVYGVLFDGDNYAKGALEWELLPDSPEGVKELERLEEVTA